MRHSAKKNRGKKLHIEKKTWLKLLRMAGIVFGFVCLCGFWAPLAVAGILNLGNITGMILSIMWILYMIFTPVVHKLIGKLWTLRFAKIPMAITGMLVITCATLVVVESACMVGACMKRGTEASTAVVLGCRVYGERASLSLVERLEAAYEYLVEHPYADCVVSGGQGPGEDISEAECMYRWLVDKGIDPARIYKEDKSTSTEENIAFSKDVIEKNGLFQKIVIVTNEYHIYRAGMLADDNEIVWGAQPAQSAAWLFPTYYIRELYAILAEWILY